MDPKLLASGSDDAKGTIIFPQEFPLPRTPFRHSYVSYLLKLMLVLCKSKIIWVRHQFFLSEGKMNALLLHNNVFVFMSHGALWIASNFLKILIFLMCVYVLSLPRVCVCVFMCPCICTYVYRSQKRVSGPWVGVTGISGTLPWVLGSEFHSSWFYSKCYLPVPPLLLSFNQVF